MKDHLLEQVRSLADQAHGDQVRRYTGARYIVHPDRVMEICSEYTSDISVLSAALLHDVLEDTPFTQEQLEDSLRGILGQELAMRTVKLVVDLTDIYTKQNYPRLNRRKRKAREAERLGKVHPDAQLIKYADAIDNAEDIARNDPEFAPRFLRETKDLLQKLDKGHPELHRRAVRIVEKCIQSLKPEEKTGIT